MPPENTTPAPTAQTPAKKRDRTHWLYIMVIVAVVSGRRDRPHRPGGRHRASSRWARRSSRSSR